MPNLNPQMPQRQMPTGGNTSQTGLIIAIVAVVMALIAGGVYYMKFQQSVAVPPVGVQDQIAPAADSTTSIDADLGATEGINLDAEFQDIDADLKTL